MDQEKSSALSTPTMRPRAMPKSVKARLEKRFSSATEETSKSGQQDTAGTSKSSRESTSKGAPSGPASKRKIEEIIVSSQHPNDNSEEEEEPPKKKIAMEEKKDGGDSVGRRSRPMPASVRKKLEQEKEKAAEELKAPADKDKEVVEGRHSQKKTVMEEKKDGSDSVGRRSRPMPASVRKELEKKNEQRKEKGKNEELPAEVVEEYHSRKSEEKTKNVSNDSSSGDRRSRPMPASIRKKLEQEEKEKAKELKVPVDKETVEGAPSSKKKKMENKVQEEPTITAAPSNQDLSDVDDDECEVCHRVFRSVRKRQKHEKTVHFIAKPRGWEPESTSSPAAENTAASPAAPPAQPEPKKVKTSSTPPPATVHSDSGGAAEKETEDLKLEKSFDFSQLPKSGKCPICNKFITKIKRHIVNVHFKGDMDAALAASKKAKRSPSPLPPPPLPTSPSAAPQSKPGPASSKGKTKASPATGSDTTSKSVVDRLKIKPLKILSPGYQRTFKMYKTGKSKPKTPSRTTSPIVDDDDDEGGEQEAASPVPPATPPPPSEPVQPQTKSDSEKRRNKPKAMPKSKKEAVGKRSSANSTPAATKKPALECISCLATFGSDAEYVDHIRTNHPPLARIITCKICSSLFSQEADFILHMKFIHKEVADKFMEASMKDEEAEGYRMDSPDTSTNPDPPSASNKDDVKMDTVSDNSNDLEADTTMEVEEDQDMDIAITSTYSKVPGKSALPPDSTTPGNDHSSSKQNELPCSSCSVKFSDLEALRKHELYFHNSKTVNMCPICGVYPTRLGRHLLAHENKTVRCSCAPCNLNFAEFSQLLKHNLEKHPGPDGGALCAPNKPRDQTQSLGSQAKKESVEDEVYKCKICLKETVGRGNARRHVRRNHEGEFEEPADDYIQKVETPKGRRTDESLNENSQSEVVPASNTRPAPGVSSGPSRNSEGSGKNRPMPASVRAKLNVTEESSTAAVPIPDKSGQCDAKPKMSRGMPASVRAKLEAEKNKKKLEEEKTKMEEEKADLKSSKNRPMPASVRAKIESKLKSESSFGEAKSSHSPTPATSSKPTPTRPMPASVRAKMERKSGEASESASFSSPKPASPAPAPAHPSRPMPASVRAKLLRASDSTSDAERKDSPKVPNPSEERHSTASSSEVEVIPVSKKVPEVIDLADDDDEVVVMEDLSFPQPVIISHPETDAVPIDHDHVIDFNKTDELTIGPHDDAAQFSTSSFQCLLCERKFETKEGAKKHILRIHGEYREEHVENLIDTTHKEASPPATSSSEFAARKRNSRSGSSGSRAGKYHDDEDYVPDEDEEEEEEEVIIQRGTSRRPRASASATASGAEPKSVTKKGPESSDKFACKLCGKEAETWGNVKRHIAKMHSHVAVARRDDYIVPANQLDMNALELEPVDSEPFVQRYTCFLCTYFSTDENDYVRHYMKKHPGQYPYCCEYCPASFYKNHEIIAHVNDAHSGDTEPAPIQTTSVAVAKEEPPTQMESVRTSTTPSQQKKYRPGPASKKHKLVVPSSTTADDEAPPAEVIRSTGDNNDNENSTESVRYIPPEISFETSFQSLFPALAEEDGCNVLGGIRTLDDDGNDLD